MNNEEQKKYFAQVNDFITFAKKNNEELEKLSSNVSSLANNINKLKSIEELNTFLSNLDSNISKVDVYNKSLEGVFGNINQLESMNDDINATKENLSKASAEFKKIDQNINNLISTTGNINLESINNKIEAFSGSLDRVTKMIDYNMSQRIEIFAIELSRLKTDFENYIIKSDKQIDELVEENEKLMTTLKETLKTNQNIVELFKQMSESNSKTDQFLNDYIEKWYDRNVSFLGRRKK